MTPQDFKTFLIAQADLPTPTHAARTAVAAFSALLAGHTLRLPEAYWAAITALIVMQSTLGAALPASVQRLAGTAIGAALGVLGALYWLGNVWVFGIGVYCIGLLCWLFRIQRNAFRYASITLAIIMLVHSNEPPLTLAVHRFIEVSLGIAVALLLTAIWPEKVPAPKASSVQSMPLPPQQCQGSSNAGRSTSANFC